jgi:hypothetical protein
LENQRIKKLEADAYVKKELESKLSSKKVVAEVTQKIFEETLSEETKISKSEFQKSIREKASNMESFAAEITQSISNPLGRQAKLSATQTLFDPSLADR